MSVFSYRPDYHIALTQPLSGPRATQTRTWRLHSLRDLSASLTTTGVGTMQLALWDIDNVLSDHVQPAAMDVVEVQTTNRHGQWGQVWTGYIDTVTRSYDPDNGNVVTLDCTSPYKLWEITHQTPDDVFTLAQAYMSNLAGSSVLTYSARAVGYNPALLLIDPKADTGSGLWSTISESTWTNPDQATWSSTMQQLLANSGLEFFFREDGRGVYRQIGYLPDPFPHTIPLITLLDILHADVAESDQGVVTRIQVTWSVQENALIQQAAFAQAPAGMIAHLRQRTLQVYAPWLLTYAAAQYLATTLLDQYAAGVATASVTIPADPRFQIGGLCAVPSLKKGHGPTTYYITGIVYQLTWAGSWVMTLALKYGRDGSNAFPYIGDVTRPVVSSTVAAGLPAVGTTLPTDPSNPRRISTPFTVVLDRTVNKTAVATPDFPVGTVLQVRDGSGYGGVGASGEYTAVSPAPGQATRTLGLTVDAGVTAYVTVIALGYGDSGGTGSQTGTAAGQTGATPGTAAGQTGTPGTGRTGTGQPAAGSTSTPGTIMHPRNLAERVLASAVALKGQPYRERNAGPRAWDCSGLVAFALAAQGFQGCLFVNGGTDPVTGEVYNTDIGPSGLWTYLQQHGATISTVDASQPGDVLFVQHQDGSDPYGQAGFTHTCFCLTPGGYGSGMNFGANNLVIGICASPIKGWPDNFGFPINLCLDMSTIHL